MMDENTIKTQHIVNRTHMTIMNNRHGINKTNMHKISIKTRIKTIQNIIQVHIRRETIILVKEVSKNQPFILWNIKIGKFSWVQHGNKFKTISKKLSIKKILL